MFPSADSPLTPHHGIPRRHPSRARPSRRSAELLRRSLAQGSGAGAQGRHRRRTPPSPRGGLLPARSLRGSLRRGADRPRALPRAGRSLRRGRDLPRARAERRGARQADRSEALVRAGLRVLRRHRDAVRVGQALAGVWRLAARTARGANSRDPRGALEAYQAAHDHFERMGAKAKLAEAEARIAASRRDGPASASTTVARARPRRQRERAARSARRADRPSWIGGRSGRARTSGS